MIRKPAEGEAGYRPEGTMSTGEKAASYVHTFDILQAAYLVSDTDLLFPQYRRAHRFRQFVNPSWTRHRRITSPRTRLRDLAEHQSMSDLVIDAALRTFVDSASLLRSLSPATRSATSATLSPSTVVDCSAPTSIVLSHLHRLNTSTLAIHS